MDVYSTVGRILEDLGRLDDDDRRRAFAALLAMAPEELEEEELEEGEDEPEEEEEEEVEEGEEPPKARGDTTETERAILRELHRQSPQRPGELAQTIGLTRAASQYRRAIAFLSQRGEIAVIGTTSKTMVGLP